MIPEYDAVVIDEAHELVARVTQAATDELTAPDVERAARQLLGLCDDATPEKTGQFFAWDGSRTPW